MTQDVIGKWELSRRRVLGGVAAAAGLGSLGYGSAAMAQAAGPWSQAPRGRVDRLNFVV